MNKLQVIQSRIYNKEELGRQIAIWRFKGKKIVFSNGCFDILHLGHIDYLSQAADQGHVLIIGLNSDASIKKIKVGNRPIIDEDSRAKVLASVHFVDAVILFDEETPYELIKFVQPDVLVKGNDYEPEDIAGYDIVKDRGGEIITIELVPGYSTTQIENKIKNQ